MIRKDFGATHEICLESNKGEEKTYGHLEVVI